MYKSYLLLFPSYDSTSTTSNTQGRLRYLAKEEEEEETKWVEHNVLSQSKVSMDVTTNTAPVMRHTCKRETEREMMKRKRKR